MLKRVLVPVTLVTLGVVGLLHAQPASPIKRTPLQKFDVPGTSYETVIGLAEVAANATVDAHTHPGPESGYVLEGNLTLMVEGKAPLALKAGDSYQVPPVAVHSARTGDRGAKLIVTYVVVKGQPLASPVKP